MRLKYENFIEDDPDLKQVWDEALKEARKSLQENNKRFIDSLKTIGHSLVNQHKDYNDIIKAVKETEKESSEFKKLFFGASDKDKFYTAMHYQRQRNIINSSNLSHDEKTSLTNMNIIDENNTQKKNNEGGIFRKTIDQTADEFSDGLQDIILGYKSFSESMKSIGEEMTRYMLKQLTDTLMQMILSHKGVEAAKATMSYGGGVFTSVRLLGKALFKRHSGGIIPVGANTQLPGTEEQLALLKGGERILSPAENTDYNNTNKSGSSPIVFNNFNVKAWDSKDVKKYLLENKHLINSITYDGIKNNNQQLRNIVRNA